MKKNKTIGLSALLLAVAFAANAQNVWTGTTTPTTTTGQVGIGNSSPGAQLDVVNPTGTYPVGLKVKRNTMISAANNIVEVWNYSNELDFWIDGGGYVGIKRLASSGPNKMVTVGSTGYLEVEDVPIIPAPQTLSISGSTLSISGGNSVTLPTGSGGDNLGNHTATGDLNMNLKKINQVQSIGFGFAGPTISPSGPELSISSKLGVNSQANSYALNVGGDVRCVSLLQTSDLRFKENIQPISDHRKLNNIKAYTYKFKEKAFPEMNFDTKQHYGFIAQEVEQEFPELVSKDDQGFYSVNYSEFIPLLLQQIQDQDKRITALEETIKRMTANNGKAHMDNTTELFKGSTLQQNVPNPFNRETTIRFNITDNFDKAFIGIYDLNGKQVKRITIKEANSQITVPANILSPGTYIYSLMVEGQLIDSKKMVVID